MGAPKRRILLTGSLGHLGAAVARELAAAGYDLTCIDRRLPDGNPPGVFLRDDLSDVGRLADLMNGIDTVVHCAAIPTLHAASEETVFATNVTTTVNILLAAERVGIRRFVYASSQSALGFAYATRVIPPDWLPVDETHLCRPVEGYGLSKRVGEQLCEMVSARSTMTTVVLRFPVIWSHERFEAHTRKRLDDPVQAAKSQWAYIDLRDAAVGCRLSVEAAIAHRHRIFNIGADRPFELADTAATLKASYGDVDGLLGVAASGDAVFDTRRAKNELGFQAQWRWNRIQVEHV